MAQVVEMGRTEMVVIPELWKDKLGFLNSTAETRETFFERIAEIYPPFDKRYELLERAYSTVQRAFRNVERDGGGKYINHLRSTALILLVHMRVADAHCIAAALLHDIVEDIPEWTHDRVVSEFGKEIAALVWWLTKPKLPRLKTKQDEERKYHRNLLRAPRAAVRIKLADRLHNLLTIWQQDPERIRRKIAETRDFILPLAEEHGDLIHEIEDVLKLLEEKYAA